MNPATTASRSLRHSLALVLMGVFALPGCEVSDPDEWRAADEGLEELRLELEDVPVFDATTRLLQTRRKTLDWKALSVDDQGTVSIPVVSSGNERAPQVEMLWVARDSDGEPLLYVTGEELAGDDVIDDLQAPTDGELSCNYGAFVYSTGCNIATNTGQMCINGQPLYKRTNYSLDYYVNGRIRGKLPTSILYNCGVIPSSNDCSTACNVNPCAPYGNWEFCGIDLCCQWGSNCNICI